MISESVFLFQDHPRVRRRVSEGGRGLRPPRHDEKGNNGIENITDKRDISNEFGRSTGREVQRGLVFVGVLFSSKIRVEFLEILVSAVLESTLRLDSMSTVILVPRMQSSRNSRKT